MKHFLLILAILFWTSNVSADRVQITLKERPYYDRKGKIVDPGARKNRPRVDPFNGGGKDGYPSKAIEGKTIERHEKGTKLLFRADVTPAEITTIKGTILTDEQAAIMKETVFGAVVPAPVSGVTK